MSGATPRTDAAAYHYCSYSGVTTDPRGEHVSARFARTLESDLAEALAVIGECNPLLMRAGFVLKSDSAARLALVEKNRLFLAKHAKGG